MFFIKVIRLLGGGGFLRDENRHHDGNTVMPRLSSIPIKVLAILICTRRVRASSLGIKASSPEVFVVVFVYPV
jgi:hypothetical protein